MRQKVNRRGEAELVYENIVFRFVGDRLVEASFKTPCELDIDGETVAFSRLLAFLKERDAEYFENYGFGVAPQLGLAFDLEHSGTWTTAFERNRWDAFKKKANQPSQPTPPSGVAEP